MRASTSETDLLASGDAAPTNDTSARGMHTGAYDTLGRRKTFGIPAPKNPLKRLGSAIKREIEDIKAFNAMSLEEIQQMNSQRMMEERRRKEERVEKMERKYGVVGKTLALGGQATYWNRGTPVYSMVSMHGRAVTSYP